MKAHIRIRRYGQEWLGWGKLFQGSVPPLSASEPCKEPKVPEMSDKYCAIFEHKEPVIRMNLIQFGVKFIRFMRDHANIVVKEKMVNGPVISFHQPYQEVEVTDIVVDIMRADGRGWDRSEYSNYKGNVIKINGLIKKGLPAFMNVHGGEES